MTDNIEMPAFLKREKVTATTAVEIIAPTVPAPAPSGWRSRLKVHPAAEMFPLLEPDELRALADDIKANGLLNKATVWWDGHTPVLLDGRNRLDALELAGMMEHSPCGDIAEHLWEPVSNLYENCEHLDPYALVIGLNIHRRHLTREQKRDLIANLLKAQPEKSDRQIAATAKVDHKTVAAVRTEQQGRGEIPHVETRTDSKGRKQPTKKSVADDDDEEEAERQRVAKLSPGHQRRLEREEKKQAAEWQAAREKINAEIEEVRTILRKLPADDFARLRELAIEWESCLLQNLTEAPASSCEREPPQVLAQ
jgi:hypothetical protein